VGEVQGNIKVVQALHDVAGQATGVGHHFYAGQHLCTLKGHAAGHDQADVAAAEDQHPLAHQIAFHVHIACGNVVQVHDLVDFVSGESELAGAAAANYIQNGPVAAGRVLTVKPGADLGYTLPQRIRLEGVEKSTNVSFRVRRICGKSTILVKSGDTVIARFKRDRLAPGEMEHIALPRVLLDRAPMDEVTIEIEEA